MLAETARILWRRRLWTALAVLIALLVGVGTFAVIKPSQESKAEVLLVPPVIQPGVTGPTNPFFSLGNSTLVMTSVVQVLVMDDSVAARLISEGNRAKYTVGPNLAQNAGPTMLIKVDDKSAAVTQQTLTAVLAEIKQQLHDVQTSNGVASNQLITSVALTSSPHPLPVRKTQVQFAVVALVLTLIVLIVILLLVERRRSRPKPAETAEAGAAPAKTETSPAPTRAGRQTKPNRPQRGDARKQGQSRSGNRSGGDRRAGDRRADGESRPSEPPVDDLGPQDAGLMTFKWTE